MSLPSNHQLLDGEMFHFKISHNETCKIRKNSSRSGWVIELNHATVTFGPLDLVLLHVPSKKLGECAGTIQCKSLKPKQTQVSCQDILLYFYFDNESMSYNEEGWTLATWRRPHKKQKSHPYPKEQHKQNIRRYPKKKEENKPKRKQDIVQVDNLLVQKLITPVTLGEYFPLEFFNRWMMTSTHMVSCHENSEEDEPSEDEESALGTKSSKTKEEIT